MMPASTATTLAAVSLALVHLGARYLTRVHRVPRSAWLSAASGVSVAYVFVQLLPEVAAIQAHLSEGAAGALPYLESHAWLLALVGLTTFYGLQQHAERVMGRTGGHTTDEVGWLHVGSFALYSALIGLLLREQAERGTATLVLFTIAIGLHMLVNDSGLRREHGSLYHDRGRWVLAAAVIAGWLISLAVDLPEAAVGLPLAFLSGSVVLNVLKEELPTDRESRLAPFVLGAGTYSALLLAI